MPVLGVTQILSWGTIFYTPVLIVPLIAHERGWSMSFAMGGFSVALLVAGLIAPYVGRSIDRFGGQVTMTVGSLTGALGLVLIGCADSRIAYYAVWMVLGAAMSMNLYDSAFASLGRIFGAGARRPITALTLAGGFASTVSWPATHFLLETVGWRGTYLAMLRARLYRGAAACLVLPRVRFETANRRHPIRRGHVLPRTACRLFSSRPRLRPPLSCRRVCRRICWQSLRAPASMPAP